MYPNESSGKNDVLHGEGKRVGFRLGCVEEEVVGKSVLVPFAVERS